MAWTDTCKINFENSCWGLMNIRKFSANKAMKQLSVESGIPISTLWRWWREMEAKKSAAVAKMEAEISSGTPTVKNDKDQQELVIETKKLNEEKPAGPEYFKCRACGCSGKIATGGSGKPYGKKSKYFGLCFTCKKRLNTNSSNSSEDGYKVVCTHCGGGTVIPWNKILLLAKQHIKSCGEGNENGKEN